MLKNMKKIIGVTVVLFFLFIGCDKVKNLAITKTCDLANVHVIDSNYQVVNVKKVLVQDYTGHTCGNCPRAAEDLETIINKYPGKIVGMAIHAGIQFSPPKPPDFLEDFRTTAGSQWDSYFGMSAASLPKGTVNWAQVPYSQARNTWDGFAASQLASAQKAKIYLKTSLDTVALAFAVEAKVVMLTSTNYNVKLVLVITEDSIVARQKDYAPPPTATVVNGDEIPNYVFMHVLRGDVNGTWGEVLKKGPVSSGYEVTKTYCSNVSPWAGLKKNLKNTAVVAIVYTQDEGSASVKEILQVEKLYLRK